jgi:CRP-like cAMP-binding protein
VFVINKGEAIVSDSKHGVLTHLYEGHTFGELTIFSHKPRVASVTATSEVLFCMSLSKRDFEECVPESVMKLLHRRMETVLQIREEREKVC